MGRHYPGEGWRWDAEEWCGRRARAGRVNMLWDGLGEGLCEMLRNSLGVASVGDRREQSTGR